MNEVVDTALDRTALELLLAERALGADALDTSKVQSVREEMEKASARRLQPHFISSFFLEGFARLGGKAKEREPGRYQLTHVPGAIRQRARDLGLHPTLVPEYERVAFDKALINPPGQVLAEFVCPGHPLLDATIDLLMERHRDLLRRGAVLVDATDPGTDPRVLVMLEHTITDARTLSDGRPQITSRRMAFVELRPDGSSTPAGPAPYLDYAPATDEEIAAVADALQASWLTGGLEDRAVTYAIADLAREHLDEVRTRTEDAGREDRRRGEEPAHPRDRLLGPSGRARPPPRSRPARARASSTAPAGGSARTSCRSASSAALPSSSWSAA